jgi:hypothetical protein
VDSFSSQATHNTGVSASSGGPAAAAAPYIQYNALAQQLYSPSSSAQPNSTSTWQYQQSIQQRNPYGVPSNIGTHTGYQAGLIGHPTNTSQVRSAMPKGKGGSVTGTYNGPSTLHYEEVDPSYYVRSKTFFFVGRVFSIIMNENAGGNATASITDYNSNKSLNEVKYKGNYVHTNVRRFIVVRARQEFCYAVPVFTYNGQATTKRGVRPREHGIAYSWGRTAELIHGEGGITKPPIAVVMAAGVPVLDKASRIYYGIHHPVQHNVKVKEVGYVPETHLPNLVGNWREEDDKDTEQESYVTNNAEIPEEDHNEDAEEEPQNGPQHGYQHKAQHGHQPEAQHGYQHEVQQDPSGSSGGDVAGLLAQMNLNQPNERNTNQDPHPTD